MSESKYVMISDKLKEKILKKEYLLNEKIPSELELMKEYKVSRHTIRKAISLLVNEGYLKTIQGSGTFVIKNSLQQIAKKRTVAVISTYLSDYIFPSIIRGIENELSNHNYSLMLISTNNNPENEKYSLKKILRKQIDGVIIEPTKSHLVSTNLNYYLQIQNENIPLLMLHANYDELDTPVIRMDDIQGGSILTEHLVKQGHQKIAFICKVDDKQGKMRLKGFLEKITEYNYNVNNKYIITYTSDTFQGLDKKISQLLDSVDSPTAFICYNDQVAVKLIKKIQKRNKNIPQDYSVVSFDASYLSSAIAGLKLTSIVHPKEEMGKQAAKWIINSIEQNNPKLPSVIFKPELIVGNSTKSIKENTNA